MIMDSNNRLSRRDFIKIAGAAGTATVMASACASDKNHSQAAEVPKGKMTYRNLNGDRISLLGYGCMRWPMRHAAEGENQEIDQEMVNALVDYAIEHGINYFDTAPTYLRGFSEDATGIALKRYPRDSYYIATKLSNFGDPSREGSMAMYRQSFIDLQTDYIDYYLLHSIGRNMEDFQKRYIDNGMLDFLIKEREAGRIRHLGWSFHGQQEVFDKVLAMHDDIHWDFVQIQLNYLDWGHATPGNVNAEYLYGELCKRNIPSIIMEPLLGGRLSNVPDRIAARLKEQDPQSSVASWAFRFAGSPEMVLTVLSGMTYMEHLQDNIRTYSPLVPLTDEDKAFLEETARQMHEYPTIPCNDCQYCMPCPYGIDIPGVLLHYNKCVNEGNLSVSSSDSNYRQARRAFLIGYDRSVPKLRQADHCIGCGQCNEHCPQAIDIPKEMQRINAYVEKLKQGTL